MHELIELKDNIYVFTPGANDKPLFALIKGDSNSIIIDGGSSPSHTKLFLDTVSNVLDGHIYALLTHWHWDHIFGSAALPFPIIASKKTSNQIELIIKMKWDNNSITSRVNKKLEHPFCSTNMLQEMKNPSASTVKMPDITFSNSLEIELDNVRKTVIKHVGGDHSTDSSIVHLPFEKIVFLGDCISPAIDMEKIYYTKSRLLPLLSNLIDLNADCYYESHSMEPITLNDLVIFRDYILESIKSNGILYDNLNRQYFPKNHKNKFINDILKCWDMFIDHTL
ncbi:MAG: MBL fold metallo-hydrolase [bacterium]|nr:MBL fold metallo-hydrolase [bacterium]